MEVTFMIFLSLIIFILGVVILITKINLAEYGIKSEGEIVDVILDEEEVIDAFNNRITLKVYKPIVKFNTIDGEEKRVVLDMVRKEEDIEIGEKVNILYYDNKPNNIILDSKKQMYSMPILLISIGIMLFVFSFVLATK